MINGMMRARGRVSELGGKVRAWSNLVISSWSSAIGGCTCIVHGFHENPWTKSTSEQQNGRPQ